MTSQRWTLPSDGYPRSDLSLARLLERAEAVANAAYVTARARLEPNCGAGWIDVGGVYAMFDGPGSPLTQTFGLGLFDPFGDAEFTGVEAFFQQRRAPVHHEVSPIVSQELLAELHRRGYYPIEHSSVLVRPVMGLATSAEPTVQVRQIGEDEVDLWARVAAEGWGTESAELATFVEDLGRVTARADGARAFFAFIGGEPVAAGGLFFHEDVALLSGASTIPSARRQGAQSALLDARLAYAAGEGAELAMMVAAPGSASHRNAERHGFRVVYTRTKWLLDDRRQAPS
jgi:GNAT superfamily N-acetyltransferase